MHKLLPLDKSDSFKDINIQVQNFNILALLGKETTPTNFDGNDA